jgi:hypothetical protein
VKPSRLYALSLCAALSLIALTSSAQTQKPTQPTPAQLQQRIDQLQKDLDQAKLDSKSAAMEKDYITRIQKQYETYYEKAFNTQIIIITVMALLVGLFGKFGVDHIIQSKLTEASAHLRTEFNQGLDTELQKLKDSNAADTKQLKETLTTEISQLGQNLSDRSNYQFQFAQGMASAADERFEAARLSYRRAVILYKTCKARQLLKTISGRAAIHNMFTALKKASPETFVEQSKQELADPLFTNLDDELAGVALELEWLKPLINERIQNPPAPLPPTPQPPNPAFEAPTAEPAAQAPPVEPVQ